MFCTLDELALWLKDKDDIAVITHFRPDGDAYGCALSLTFIMKKLGKRAFPVCDDCVEPKFRFLQGWNEFANEKTGLPFKPVTAIGVDVSDEERMGESAAVYRACEYRAAIDHHATNTGFAPLTYVEPEAAAAGELILKLADKLGVALTRPIAEQIYTAVSTDSGNFSFRDTSSNSFMTAARCVEAGIDVEDLTRRLYRERTYAKTRLIAMALSRIVLSPGGLVAGIMLPESDFEQSGAEREDSHSIVNYLNEIQGVNVGILAEQRGADVKISFRGANGTDVAKLAGLFNGGGHLAAAGGKIPGAKLEDEFDRIMRVAAEYCGEV